MVEGFTFLDGERLVRFGAGALDDAPGLLSGRGFESYVLLTTARARRSAPTLVGQAAAVVEVPGGGVPEVAAAVRKDVGDRPLVALGGGRVIDAAKAIAAADLLACAAVPTTLSGAEMTGFHRMPAGVEAFRLVRPSLVIADPALMASQPDPALAASAMNALAHAIEALYAPLANPVSELAALEAIGAIGTALTREPPERPELALAALLAGYASGVAGFAIHHAVCQTIVRVGGTPHAQTNAVMLAHVAALMAPKAPAQMALVASALGVRAGGDVPAAIRALAARSGLTRLRQLGLDREKLQDVLGAVMKRGDWTANTPNAPTEDELRQLLEEAL